MAQRADNIRIFFCSSFCLYVSISGAQLERLFYCRWYVGVSLTYHTCQPWEGPFVITYNCQFTRWPSRERRNQLEQMEVLLQMPLVYQVQHKRWILTRKHQPKHFALQSLTPQAWVIDTGPWDWCSRGTLGQLSCWKLREGAWFNNTETLLPY